VAAVAVSFAANQAMLHLILTLLGHAAPARSAAQLMAIATYTALQFVLLRVWVFKSAASGPA
jgi:putative flippase GtrA